MNIHKAIVVPAAVTDWEHQYHLPPITGTPRQVGWARLIRQEFLPPVFENIIEATASLKSDEARAVFECLDKVRATTDPCEWIEVLRHHTSHAVELIMKMPPQRAGEPAKHVVHKQEQDERDRVAAARRRVAAEARKWEAKFELPPLDGGTTHQINFARRCRYQMCCHVPEQARQQGTDARDWIDRFLKAEADAAAKLSEQSKRIK